MQTPAPGAGPCAREERAHALSHPSPSDSSRRLCQRLRLREGPAPGPGPRGATRKARRTHWSRGQFKARAVREASVRLPQPDRQSACSRGQPRLSCTTPSSETRCGAKRRVRPASRRGASRGAARPQRFTGWCNQSKGKYREDRCLRSLCTALKYSSVTNSKILKFHFLLSLFPGKIHKLVLKIRFNKELMRFAWLSDTNFWLDFYRLILIKRYHFYKSYVCIYNIS